MKYLISLSIACAAIILSMASCKKETMLQVASRPVIARKVQFLLYTNKDFSTDNKTIVFKMSIQRSTNQVLWDSVLAPMRIKDIPAMANKIVVEKWVPGNDNSLLKVGFYYAIENVGNSWYLDSCNAGTAFKIVDFNFQ